MPVFFLAEIEVHDPEIYRRYIERAAPIIKQYGGEHVFRSDKVLPISGDWSPGRLILIRFPNKTDLQRCLSSPEYLEVKGLRERSTTSRAVIIEEDPDEA